MANESELKSLVRKRVSIPSDLHEYQWQGVSFLYNSPAALLADEMGLGKTIQTIIALTLLLKSENEVQRALIVAPASLTINWLEEIEKWSPSIAARLIQGSQKSREPLYLLPIPVLIGSYEQIRMDALDRIPSGTFDIVILDEAQRIKNKNSTTSLACRILPRKRSWALSATPLENNRSDVESILKFLDPKMDRDLPIIKLQEILKEKMLRRKKAEVRAELPPVINQELKIKLSGSQKRAYDKLWIGRLETINTSEKKNLSSALLGLITKLKIACNFDEESNTSSKLDALKTIAEGMGESARILVFSQFVKTLHWISERITTPHDFLTGSMKLSDRKAAIDRFNSAETPRMLLTSLRAGGVGLNLGKATHVVMFDRWWNPAVEMQAIYRAHRFERDEPLHVVSFLVSESIEERIDQIIKDKKILFDEVVETSRTDNLSSFTIEDFMNILDVTGRQ